MMSFPIKYTRGKNPAHVIAINIFFSLIALFILKYFLMV